MLQDQVIPISFGDGIDTKTDAKQVVPGKFLRLENAVFTSPKRATKRNGYQAISSTIAGGSTISAPKLVKSFKNELVCANAGVLYGYSSTQTAWVSRGVYNPVAVSKTGVSKSTSSSHKGSAGAVYNNIGIFAWTANLIPTATVVDLATGTVLIADTQLCTAGANAAITPEVHCVVMAGNTLAVVYKNTLYKIAMRKITISGGNATLGSEVVLNADVLNATTFVCCGASVGGAVSYATSGVNIRTVSFDTSGTVLVTLNTATTANSGPLHINQDATNSRFWLYFIDTTGGFQYIYFYVLSSALVGFYGPGQAVGQAAGAGSTYTRATAASVSSTSQYLIYQNAVTTSSVTYPVIRRITLTSSGSVGPDAAVINNLDLSSHPMTIGSGYYFAANNYTVSVVGSGLVPQGTLFIINAADGTVYAKALLNSAPEKRIQLSQPYAYGSGKYLYPAGDQYRLSLNATSILGTSYITLDPSHADLYRAVEGNNNLILNGGQLYAYDGDLVAELGFSLYPDVLLTTSSGTGSMGAGTYSYYFTYRWTDVQGNIYESSPSTGTTVTLAAGGSVVHKIACLTVTQKETLGSLVEIVVYRTSANGTVAREILDTSGSVLSNSPSAGFVTFTDQNSDTGFSARPALYTTGNVLSNDCPPPALAMLIHNNRLWVINSETNEIWYSKTFLLTDGVNLSGNLLITPDKRGGNPVALAELDDKLVVFEQNAPVVYAGDGANDTGSGSTLSQAFFIPSDAGGVNSKGVITCPLGVIYRASNNKGFYLLDRSLSVKYVGMDVESYNSQNVSAVTMIPDKSQIRFLTDSGSTLVYDYIFNKWSTFTNHAGYSADIYNGVYVYAKTDGTILQESSGYYLDNATAYAVLAQTAHLSLSTIQGFQRVKRFAMLGDYANGNSASHAVRVSAAYDFSTSFSTPISYLFGSTSTSGVFQYRERLPTQKCDSISLLIEEVTTGSSLESINLTDMSFEAGMKKGLNKLSSASTVA